jgi:hypothetical protein
MVGERANIVTYQTDYVTQTNMSKLETSESHNLPLVGKIDLDAGYLRKEPKHDKTSSLSSIVSKLREATNGDNDRCSCETCSLLRLWIGIEIEEARTRERLERDLE